ncbi:MAG: hypothetical protein HC774_08340 [Sphingomonadales bacterium]|nr:hypothetical protein [Sphingomonadales bacterium]
MIKFPTIQLKYKLPLIIVGFSLMVGVALQIAVYQAYRDKTLETLNAEFQGTANSRHDSLDAWISQISGEILIEAASPATADAILELGSAYRAIPGNPTAVLQDAYISKNPNPVGERQNLMRAEGDEVYHPLHEAYHPFFLELQKQLGLYDVFLFDTQGNLVYSVFKELDFATNFASGPMPARALAPL